MCPKSIVFRKSPEIASPTLFATLLTCSSQTAFNPSCPVAAWTSLSAIVHDHSPICKQHGVCQFRRMLSHFQFTAPRRAPERIYTHDDILYVRGIRTPRHGIVLHEQLNFSLLESMPGTHRTPTLYLRGPVVLHPADQLVCSLGVPTITPEKVLVPDNNRIKV